jgi:hypothetical protein
MGDSYRLHPQQLAHMGEAVHMRLVEDRLQSLEAASSAKTITYRKVG